MTPHSWSWSFSTLAKHQPGHLNLRTSVSFSVEMHQNVSVEDAHWNHLSELLKFCVVSTRVLGIYRVGVESWYFQKVPRQWCAERLLSTRVDFCELIVRQSLLKIKMYMLTIK